MREAEALMRIQANEDVTIEEVCKHLQSYTGDIKHALADLVASLCDITKEELLKDAKHTSSSYARWLYWYAYRQLTNESYDSMARQTLQYQSFSAQGIGKGVSNMSMLIASDTIWTKRYAIIKKVIRAANRCEESKHSKDITVKIIAPKDIKIEIKQE